MILQYLAYGFLIALYALFAWFGKAPVDGFLAVLTAALSGLGVHHAMQAASQRALDAANHAAALLPPRIVSASVPTSAPSLVTPPVPAADA